MMRFTAFSAEDAEQLDENLLRNASALVLFNRILNKSKKVQKSDDLNEKLNLIASQNTALSAMIFAMTQFVRKQR